MQRRYTESMVWSALHGDAIFGLAPRSQPSSIEELDLARRGGGGHLGRAIIGRHRSPPKNDRGYMYFNFPSKVSFLPWVRIGGMDCGSGSQRQFSALRAVFKIFEGLKFTRYFPQWIFGSLYCTFFVLYRLLTL